jgi:hypothetical protein
VTVRLILDTSALVAYVAGNTRSVEVGELMLNVEENGDTTGVPALCLVEAYQQVSEEQRAKLLELVAEEEGPAALLPLPAADVGAVARLALRIPIAQAHAATEAVKHGAILGTYERKTYADSIATDDILDL